jgi:hypothetical protein
VEFES